jgi:general secretion pathway protein G
MRGLMLAVVLVTACGRAERPVHDAAMRDTLASMRTALAHFRDDNGRGPHALEELVPRYLTAIPSDPVTGSASTWRIATEETVQPSGDFSATGAAPAKPQIIDVRSGAPGSDSRGKPWSDY